MANKDINRIAFEAYLQSQGISASQLSLQDGKYHYRGTRNGVATQVTFDTGTVPDGTYNVYMSDENNGMRWRGVIRPVSENEYTLREKKGGRETSVRLHAQAPAAQPPAPAQPARAPATAPANPPVAAPATPATQPAAAGEYRIFLVRDAQDPATPKMETGRIIITGPGNAILSDNAFKSGGYGLGFAPHVGSYRLATEIRPFTSAGRKPVTQDGLRIANESFADCPTPQERNRTGILIHEDKSPPGTMGCFGIQGADGWEDFRRSWEAIPLQQRPREMRPITPEEYQALKAAQPKARADLPVNMAAALALAADPNYRPQSGTVPLQPRTGEPGTRSV